VTVRGDLALIVMAGLVVVRRTMWVSPSPSSMASVVSETTTVRVRRAWTRPRPRVDSPADARPSAHGRRGHMVSPPMDNAAEQSQVAATLACSSGGALPSLNQRRSKISHRDVGSSMQAWFSR
jgi:hypothetical protein